MKLSELIICFGAIIHLLHSAGEIVAAPNENRLVLQVPTDGARLIIPAIGEVFPEREVTIEFWQKVIDPRTTDHVAVGALICEPQCKLGVGVHAPYPETQNLQWGFGSDELGGTFVDVLHQFPVFPTDWQHFAFTASSQERKLRIYQNGNLLVEKTGVTAYLPRFAWSLEVGRPGVQMTEFRVWNYSRTPEEVQDMFDKRAAGAERGLILCLPLDGRLIDLSVRKLPLEGGASFWAATDELPALAIVDTDFDGIADRDEHSLYGTDPNKADTDGDGVNDGVELGIGRYQIVIGQMTWAEALQDANRMGGHLATFTSQREWEFVVSRFGSELKGLALGGTDAEQEGQWRWITDEPWTFSNWYPGQPDNLGTGQHNLWLASGYPDLKWDDGLLDEDRTSATGYLLEYGYATDPVKFDSDGDGFSDGSELQSGSNPLLATETPSLFLSAYVALELNFPTRLGINYQVQSSVDGIHWTEEGESVPGTGQTIALMLSTRQSSAKLYRLIEN